MQAKRRLFFALWPSADVRKQIVACAKQLPVHKARAVANTNLHITLAFIGAVDKDKVDHYINAAASVKAKAFHLKLNQAGCFSRAKVLWLGCDQVEPALQDLVSSLNHALLDCGYVAEDRPYTPHVTLARKFHCKQLPEIDCEIDWNVDSFALVESLSVVGGVEYKVLESWSMPPPAEGGGFYL